MARALKIVKSGAFSQAGLDKLESSGLTADQAESLGIYEVTNAAELVDWFESRPALVLPYHATDGAPLAAHPKWPAFYRVRYLGHPSSFASRESRYAQPAGTGTCAYFPPAVNWKAIEADPSEAILITEGELKAGKACVEGFPTIGLGGVHNFRAAKQGVFFLPELERFNWVRRRVTIVYDSDYADNANICNAINKLAEELQERGAMINVATLPAVYADDRKTGLDDFLLEKGDDALVQVLSASEPLGITRELWSMNEEVVYIEDPGFVLAQASGQKLPVTNFNTHSRWATASTAERKVGKEGKVSYEKVPAAPVWLRWPLRKAVTKLTYKPGEDKFYTERGVTFYNQWKGWGVEPKKGNVDPWLKLINFLFTGAEPGAVKWFLDWCAYPLQYPGTKLFSACLIHGRMTGTGKTLIFYTLKKIYGENFIKIKNEDLRDTWWLENKQFVLGDEISGNDKRSESDALKSMVTQEEVNINVKYVPQFSIPDCANYGFTSNHSDALFMEDEDRRLFVHEVQSTEPLPLSFYKEYDSWKDGEGAAALFEWLLKRDLKDFNPKGPAFRTAARSRMVMQGKSDLDTWCAELKANPGPMLRFGQTRHVKDLFSSKELLAMYMAQNDVTAGKVTANGMSRALAKAGFVQAYSGNPIMLGDVQARYYIARNPERWAGVKVLKEFTKNLALTPVRE